MLDEKRRSKGPRPVCEILSKVQCVIYGPSRWLPFSLLLLVMVICGGYDHFFSTFSFNPLKTCSTLWPCATCCRVSIQYRKTLFECDMASPPRHLSVYECVANLQLWRRLIQSGQSSPYQHLSCHSGPAQSVICYAKSASPSVLKLHLSSASAHGFFSIGSPSCDTCLS